MSYRSVFCTVSSPAQANRVVSALNAIEFPRSDISALFIDSPPRDAVASGQLKTAAKRKSVSTSAASPRVGLDGIAALNPLPIPGTEQLMAAGLVAAAFSDAEEDGVAGGLIAFGVPDSEAGRYEGRIKEGHVFMSVRSENPDTTDRVRAIFAAEGAESIRTMMDVFTPKVSWRNTVGAGRGTMR